MMTFLGRQTSLPIVGGNVAHLVLDSLLSAIAHQQAADIARGALVVGGDGSVLQAIGDMDRSDARGVARVWTEERAL
jgi:hypothetical protein